MNFLNKLSLVALLVSGFSANSASFSGNVCEGGTVGDFVFMDCMAIAKGSNNKINDCVKNNADLLERLEIKL